MTEQSLFADVLDIPDPAERAAFLDRACGADTDLRRRLDRLLERHRDAGSFLGRPPAPPGETVSFAADGEAEDLGTRIGPYKLLEAIGHGGMGVVYMAEQTEPVKRRVALKVIKPGMDSGQVVARFEAERQALALMDHPSIARVFDGGTTPSGRPYFVMELVRGLPVTEYCDEARLSVPERLALFVQVCRAVQHAHQKGVIHRDLKPSNVLVTEIDGRPVPKVIDFGIAKATGAALTDRTLFTGFHQLVGTPMYMSPEQTGVSGVDVDTRADVYSLGVLLYELLTGTTPFDGEALRSAGFDEMRRIIREDEPDRPSRRVSTLAAAQSSTISERRKLDPRRLGRLMRSELDWVVMTALEKDRNRRYESASAFVADVERYLADEPVLAAPPSVRYRLRKFARRNRRGVLTAAAVALALVAGTAVSVWQAVEADSARKAADERAAGEANARAEAEANFRLALEAIDRTLTAVGEEGLRDIPQMDSVRQQLLQDALEFYRLFLARRGTDPSVRLETSLALSRVAKISGQLGRQADARAAYNEAAEILSALHDEEPANDLYRFDLANVYNDLAWQPLGTHVEKLALHDRAALLLRPLIDGRPADYELRGHRIRGTMANTLRSRGGLRIFLGRFQEAEEELTAAIALTSDDSGWGRDVLASTYSTLARLHHARKRSDKAVDAMRKGIAAREDMVNADLTAAVAKSNSKNFYRCELAIDLLALGRYLTDDGRLEEIDGVYRRACELVDPLAADFPSRPGYRRVANQARTDWAPVLIKLERRDEAGRVLDAVRPQTANDYLARAALYHKLDNTEKELADLTEAIRLNPKLVAAYQKRIDLSMKRGAWQRVVADVDSHERFGRVSWHIYKRLAYVHFHRGDYPKALIDITKAVDGNPSDSSNFTWIALADVAACPDAAFRQGMIDQATRAIELTKDSSGAYAARAALYAAMKEDAKARDDWAKAAAALRRQADEQDGKPDRDAALKTLASAQAVLGHSLLYGKMYAEAEPILRDCLAAREKLLPDDWLRFSAMSLLGEALLGQGKYAEAEPLLLAAHEGIAKRVADVPPGAPQLREAVERLVQLYDATNRPEKAREWTAKLPPEVAPRPRFVQ